MLKLLTKKDKCEANFKPKELDVLLAKIAQIYRIEEISPDRKKYLSKTMRKYGYLPYPQYKVLQELTPAEAIYCLVEKLIYAKTFDVNKFNSDAVLKSNRPDFVLIKLVITAPNPLFAPRSWIIDRI